MIYELMSPISEHKFSHALKLSHDADLTNQLMMLRMPLLMPLEYINAQDPDRLLNPVMWPVMDIGSLRVTFPIPHTREFSLKQ